MKKLHFDHLKNDNKLIYSFKIIKIHTIKMIKLHFTNPLFTLVIERQNGKKI